MRAFICKAHKSYYKIDSRDVDFLFCWEFVYLRFWTSNEWLKSRIIVDITFENDIDLIPNETPYDQIKNVNILCSLYLSLVLTQIMKKK